MSDKMLRIHRKNKRILHSPSIRNAGKVNVVAIGSTFNTLKVEAGVSSPVKNCIPYFNNFTCI